MHPYRTRLAVLATLILAWCGLVVVFANSGASPSLRLGAPMVLAVLGVAAAARFEWQRRQRVRRIESEAQSLLDTPVGVPPSAATSASPLGEFAALHEILREVRLRESGQLKDAAKKSRNLEALIDAIDEPVLATDNNNAVLLCNRSAEVFFDAPAGTLKGRSITDLFTQAEVLDMHAAARAGDVRRQRVRLTTPLGAGVFQVSASPVPAAWGAGIFGAVLVLRDVTELDQAAAVKTDFVANASHELRTPVAAIRGAAETLEQCLEEDPKAAGRFAGMIVQHAARLEEMLRDLLDLSRLESTEAAIDCREIDFLAFQSSLVAQFQETAARKDLTLAFEIDERLIGLHTDPKLLMVIVRNLIENAIKFAYEHTTIRVTGALVSVAKAAATTPLSHANAALETNAAPAEGMNHAMVRFEVADRGIGIPFALQERVFERYFQVESSRTASGTKRGTGLGLSIVKHAAKSLGGQVGLSSVWHEGTTVWVEFPAWLPARSSETRPISHP